MVEITIDVKTVGVFRPHERREIEKIRQRRICRVVNKHEHQAILDYKKK